ncbi:MAG TPA: phenylacetate--CoA ligase [Smithella sp.]|jgi:phenylacetate-CoA ligase|nr:phenylacetate--CoA ligase [Smithella sp.]NMC97329.1 phenylacetate--CoA ligase [Deltaproteobacteria bacterium]HNQ66316.1 phenylacetate--CoA ligase [Smithella sp.]HOE32450.1 phenylacetate--CoA ligase [Smithella sp.]HOG10298.1 phenylacetate--CoA ligase [Smithella sp.]
MIYNEEFETMPREVIKALQVKRLQQVLERVYHTVGFYKKSFDAAKVKPDDIRCMADMKKLPFTTRKDLRDNYPFGLFAVPMSSVVRLHASSGTSRRSAVFGYTKRDIDTWSDLIARSLVAAGITKNDIIHNAFGYGLFTGGLGLHYGAEKIGASVIPISGGDVKRQLMILQDFGPTVLCATPSYALHLAEEGNAMGIDIKALKLRVGIFGAEPWTDAIRDDIEKAFGITALDLFGLSEVIGPGMAMECLEGRHGMHIFEDHFIVETIDPQTGDVLPEGAEGELVFTTLTKEANPLVRYRTGDISRLITEPCRCGRTHIKMERVLKRSDDMLIIRGVNVFPSQIEAILVEIEGLEPNYQVIIDKAGALDVLDLQVEVNDKIFSDSGSIKQLQKIEQRIVKDMRDYLGVSARVKLVQPNTLKKTDAKIIDKRRI